MSGKLDVLTGRRFGRWQVVGYSHRSGRCDHRWLCRCDCGTERDVSAHSLRRGHSTSCGCYALEVRAENGRARFVHGLKRTPEYQAWSDMITRCENRNRPSWKDYGGRGIAICQRWRDSFVAFLSDMGNRPSQDHSLERKNTNGNYDPENCVWATKLEQSNNRRNNRILEVSGKTITLSQAAKILSIPYSTANSRYGKLFVSRNAK